MISFLKEKCRRFLLPVCLLLSAVCSLSVVAAEEESAAEKIKRYESYEKFFSNELNSQRPLVPDFRSEYNYIGGKRPSDKGYYYADKKARRQMEKKSKIESKNGRIIILFIPSVGVFLPLKVQVLT